MKSRKYKVNSFYFKMFVFAMAKSYPNKTE